MARYKSVPLKPFEFCAEPAAIAFASAFQPVQPTALPITRPIPQEAIDPLAAVVEIRFPETERVGCSQKLNRSDSHWRSARPAPVAMLSPMALAADQRQTFWPWHTSVTVKYQLPVERSTMSAVFWRVVKRSPAPNVVNEYLIRIREPAAGALAPAVDKDLWPERVTVTRS